MEIFPGGLRCRPMLPKARRARVESTVPDAPVRCQFDNIYSRREHYKYFQFAILRPCGENCWQ
jgi:hypothetical protein